MCQDKVEPKILVLEDEYSIARYVADALQEASYCVLIGTTLKEGKRIASGQRPDLVLLDLGLPDGDGTELISYIREYSSIPIVVLSARTQEEDKIRALDLGADDYLTKPFSVQELLARLRVQLRRARANGQLEGGSVYRFGDVEVDFVSRVVKKGGETVHMTKLEYRLLTVMLENAGKVMTQRQLMKAVWGPGYADRTHYIRVYIARLREKFEQDPSDPQWFITETGVGYRFRASEE